MGDYNYKCCICNYPMSGDREGDLVLTDDSFCHFECLNNYYFLTKEEKRRADKRQEELLATPKDSLFHIQDHKVLQEENASLRKQIENSDEVAHAANIYVKARDIHGKARDNYLLSGGDSALEDVLNTALRTVNNAYEDLLEALKEHYPE